MTWRERLVVPALLLIASASIVGCAHSRVYPVCVFGPAPDLRSEEELSRRVAEFARTMGGSGTKTAIGPNSRLFAVKASKPGHQRLGAVWARVACVGQTRAEDEYRDYKQCVDLIEAAIQEGGVPPLSTPSDGLKGTTMYCGNPLARN